jgi:starch synthase (maltosyl-transferring)
LDFEGRIRVVIENVAPEINGGRYPVKRAAGETVAVEADVYADGHDQIEAVLLYRHSGDDRWREIPMRHINNDRWRAEFTVSKPGTYYYTLKGWVDHFKTWQHDVQKKAAAGQDIRVELKMGAEWVLAVSRRAGEPDKDVLEQWSGVLSADNDSSKDISLAMSPELTELMRRHPPEKWMSVYEREVKISVERPRALFSSWYEFFPRSYGEKSDRAGNLKSCRSLLPDIAAMGFEVVYLPPIHPIGRTHRKGPDNNPKSGPKDPGSPWAIGSEDGGHKSIHPDLGTMADFKEFVAAAEENHLEVAMDLAFQCSPDHPYVKEHPDWFRWRPDGTIQHAENPPKKYEDIIPLNFETGDWKALWKELKSIVLFWVEKGVRIFRVDNPHTKPFVFWEWLINEIKMEYPDVLFLAEAFTRPKVMYRLAKIGFSQSYTYFTWRNSKWEIQEYLKELTQTQAREFFRPNFWPNTPDILPESLQHGGRPAFITRLVMAATLSSNYGIYGPAFELAVNEAVPGKEEYAHSEKYEIKNWDRHRSGNIREIISRINQIRRENPALQTTWNLRFFDTDNDYLLCYGKTNADLSNFILIVVNLDPFHTQSGWVHLPVHDLDILPDQQVLVCDLISGDKYFWQGPRNYVELNPHVLPVHIFKVFRKMKREQDFDYFM